MVFNEILFQTITLCWYCGIMTTDILCRYINSYTFNVQIYHISSFKKIKMSGLQINHTIIWKCHLSIPVYIQNMMQPGYRLTVHVQTYLKNKIGRSSNISKITKQSYFVICLNYHTTSFKSKNVSCTNYSTTQLKHKNVMIRCLK